MWTVAKGNTALHSWVLISFRGSGDKRSTDGKVYCYLLCTGFEFKNKIRTTDVVHSSGDSIVFFLPQSPATDRKRLEMTKPRRSTGPSFKYYTCDTCMSTLYLTDLETHFTDNCPPSTSNWTQAFVNDHCLYSYAKLYTKGTRRLCILSYAAQYVMCSVQQHNI